MFIVLSLESLIAFSTTIVGLHKPGLNVLLYALLLVDHVTSSNSRALLQSRLVQTSYNRK